MVDLRPLLFLNALMLMLLLTAGFVQVSDQQAPIADAVPAPLVPGNAARAENNEGEKEKVTTAKSDVPSSIATKGSEEANTSRLLTREEVEEAIFADDVVFADEVLPPHRDQKTIEQIKHLYPNQEQIAQEETPASSATAPTAASAETKPKPVQAAVSRPAPNPVAKPTPKPVLKTGRLIVRSNVHEDTVLVNGKPYGSTRLELNLTPGSYAVEVAKPGYTNWSTRVDIRRGMTETLNARLDYYTSVEYVNGEWINGITTGEGSFREEGSLEYNGSFVNARFHGVGSIRYANGMKYQGEWFEGDMKGEGTLTTIDGDTYIGEFDENKFNGEGTLTKANGDIYTGFWINGELNGQGSLTTKDGLLFVGGFSDNLFHGSGSLTYPDGGHYEGSFSNGLFHGKGTEVYPNGKKYVGQFIDGLYHGKGEILNPNGSKITGTFKDGKPFGKATLTTAEGEVFTARSSEPGVCYRLKSYRATACPELEGW